MRKIVLCLVLAALVFLTSGVEAKAYPNPAACSAVLLDSTTKQVLYSKNGNLQMAPASTTKIMTAILALEKLNLNDVVVIGPKAVAQEGSSMRLENRERKTVRELLYGLMLVSGNDSAMALAEAMAGSESKFAKLMNDKAKQLGMQHTHFVNASGLPDPNHYTSAYDLAILTSYAMKNPQFARIVSTKEKTISGPRNGKNRHLINHNKMLWKYKYTTGVKPGYTLTAGGCLVSSASNGSANLIVVVLKTSYIYDDSIQLFDYGFTRSKTKTPSAGYASL
jgi:D-alanyl-D-alanine carboxypeptidase (penicillin-binding protein 5/6)